MSTAEQLKDIVRRLKAGENRDRAVEEAQALLSSLAPEDLTDAEESLVEAGLAPEDLRELCSVHMKMLEGEGEALKQALPPGHVLHTLIEEHEMILGFLDDLEAVNRGIQQMKRYDGEREEFQTLKHIATHLVEAESHHQREEDVLFPAVERKGITGPPRVMRLEHTDLRRRKKELQELALSAGSMKFKAFKKRLDTTSRFIVLMLRDHIFKENNILYPAAAQAIADPDTWDRMRSQCNEIGYCCFTPQMAANDK